MAKTYDSMAAAIEVKRGQRKLTDIPEKHQAEVKHHLTRGETKMIQRMREERAKSNSFTGNRVVTGTVRIA